MESSRPFANKRVLVVGAGIIGASIAFHLAKAGCAVTVVEAKAPGGVATAHSFAWINASWGNPIDYYRLRMASIDDWRRLEREIAGLSVAWTGSLTFDMPEDELFAFLDQHSAWGYDIAKVEADDVRRVEPKLADPPELALLVKGEAAVEPLPAARAFLAAAMQLGAEVVPRSAVRRLHADGSIVRGVQLADGGVIHADETILAAGTATAGLAETCGVAVPIVTSPAMILETKPIERVLNGIVIAPEMELRQDADGRLVAGGDLFPDDQSVGGAESAGLLFKALQGIVVDGDALELERYRIGYRPMPADGFPLVGRAPDMDGLSIAVTHSGVTLAPAIGRMIADEVLGAGRDPLLAPYGLERMRTK